MSSFPSFEEIAQDPVFACDGIEVRSVEEERNRVKALMDCVVAVIF